MKTKKYFETLDFYRFCAFLLVFISHIPFVEGSIGFFFKKAGGVGVYFFFTLSGFLITYLLLKERHLSGSINLKNFFVRRILRIWPLYYAMLLFAFVTPYLLAFFKLPSSSSGYEPVWILNFLFLDNYKMMCTKSFPNVSPLGVMWSLCIEEHFYILWGLFFRFLPFRYIKAFVIFSVVVSVLTLYIFACYNIPQSEILSNLIFFGAGAYLAYYYFTKGAIFILESMPGWLKSILAFTLLFSLFAISNISFTHYAKYLVAPIIYTLIFTLLIALTLSKSNPFKMADNYWVSKWGVYTYGLYLFHTIIINFLLKFFSVSGSKIEQLLLIGCSFLFSLGIAVLSYYFFERPFLRLKRYFR